MRIVDVCAFYAPEGGGVKTYVERKLKAGDDAGHEIIVLAPGPDGRIFEHGNGRIITLPARRFPLDRRYHYFNDEASLHAMLDDLQPDLVEASSPWSSASMVGRWQGAAPRALIMHADPLSAYAYRWFGSVADRTVIDRGFDWYWRHLRRLDQAFDLTISANSSLTQRLRSGGMRTVKTIPMGVEPGIFSPNHRDERLRAYLLECCGLGPDGMLLVAAGRHAPEKRWPQVIQAVTMAGQQHPVGLVLIGDGRSSAAVRRTAANNPHIHLLAPVSDRPELARLLASGDALIHGCEAETFCMVAAEARASGLPVIVPNQGGAADQAGKDFGIRYRSGDSASMASAISHMASTRARHWRQNAVHAAMDVATMDLHFLNLFSAYQVLRDGRVMAA
ncbi:MAG: glycosyltransferase [Novosphingobium sp.]|nr:glycosyltransferase [Novosphingobium sp.]